MVTPKRLFDPAKLTGSAATKYTSEDVAGVRTIIKKLVFTNTTAGTVNVTAYLVPKAGTAGADNALWSAKPLQAGETRECYEAENMVMEQGDFLQALGLDVTIQGSGVVITP